MFDVARVVSRAATAWLLLGLAACTGDGGKPATGAAPDRNPEETQGIVLLRGLPTLGTSHSVAIVELDPEAQNFGEILKEFDFGGHELPLHHLYYSPTGRAWTPPAALPRSGSLAMRAGSRSSTA